MDLIISIIILVLVYMTLLYLLSLLIKRSDIVDVGWGLGFILITLFLLNQSLTITPNMGIITFVVLIWGLRLAIHILSRNWGKKEDFRYQQFKKDWGNDFWWKSYINIFLFQGVLMLIISIPIIYTFSFTNYNLHWFNYLGLGIWFFGFIFETIGDLQLSLFISRKRKGEEKENILKTGLWSLTRHPNYFGEVFLWWGVWLIAININQPLSLLTIVGPLTISVLIIKVSGVPLLEKKYEGDSDWEEYKKNVPKFFPIKLK